MGCEETHDGDLGKSSSPWISKQCYSHTRTQQHTGDNVMQQADGKGFKIQVEQGKDERHTLIYVFNPVLA